VLAPRALPLLVGTHRAALMCECEHAPLQDLGSSQPGQEREPSKEWKIVADFDAKQHDAGGPGRGV